MIACRLVHHSGTMIRFTTSQLSSLPNTSRDVDLLLPSGNLISAHFHLHPANPYIGGADLVRFIKRRVAYGAVEDVLVEKRSSKLWIVHSLADVLPLAVSAGVAASRVTDGALAKGDLAALLALADSEADQGKRWTKYKRVLRPTGLRRLFIGLFGPRCMVEGCEACDQFDEEWGTGSGGAIVEVHHVEEVARRIDHSPRNLCVLCANHHSFIHGIGSWRITHHGPNVEFARANRQMTVVRPPALFGAAA